MIHASGVNVTSLRTMSAGHRGTKGASDHLPFHATTTLHPTRNHKNPEMPR